VTILEANIQEAGYGKKVVLRNVSLTVEEGEILALIGPNGAGKSTLLKALIGLVKPAVGSVKFDGKEIKNQSPEKNTEAGICFVPQGNRVFTELTVAENLEVGGYLVRDRVALDKRKEQMLSLFSDLKPRQKQNAGKLSGGEKQQLALARALILHPRILLMDEPSLGLSPNLVTKALDTVCEINKTMRTTVIIVEQKVHEVLRIATRVCAMRMGEIVYSGSAADLHESDTLRKIFL
jgi:branched-chain amino acid transport system ATP-binding protein